MSAPVPTTEQAPEQTTTPTPAANGGTPETDKRFTQAEMDAIIADRLARQQRALDAKREKDKADADAKVLAEQGEYKTLAEKAEQRAAALESELRARDHRDLQRDIAAEHKLPADLATRLQGTTREELVADAKALAKLVTAPPEPPPPGNRPGPRPQTGPSGAEETERQLRANPRYAGL